MAQIEKTVFISYRRKDEYEALAVYKSLTAQKYDVFFDFESIPSGDFERYIISNIRNRAHFLVILTPTALDRCNEPGDWLRREIETAMDGERNIIPLFFEGFDFEDPSISKNLTGKLANLQKYNGLPMPLRYFDAAMETLQEKFLNVALDAVLLPVTDEVKKVVQEQQSAANNAILQRKGDEKPDTKLMSTGPAPEKRVVEPMHETVQPASIKPPIKPGPSSGRAIYTFGDMEFVEVPEGEFVMGGYEYSNEGPQGMVFISRYYVSRFPVTNEQFDAYVQAKRIKHPVGGWKKKRDHPVVNVSWKDALAYCLWLDNLHKNELPSGLVLRLPIEPEWEKAARGTDGRTYPWGDYFSRTRCNTLEGRRKKTTPVGSYSPVGDSPYGCTDMVGNVSEWTHSLFEFYPYKLDVLRENENTIGPRVVRGGSFTHDKKHARAAYREAHDPNAIGHNLGFRVVVAPSIPSGEVSLSEL